jgi:hypothetical protein
MRIHADPDPDPKPCIGNTYTNRQNHTERVQRRERQKDRSEKESQEGIRADDGMTSYRDTEIKPERDVKIRKYRHRQ